MKVAAIFLGLIAVLAPLVAAFWWVKGQPLDWDGFSGKRWGPWNMQHPGNPLKKRNWQ